MMDPTLLFVAENDEELAIFDYILNTKNRQYYYLPRKSDLQTLRLLLNIPEIIYLKNRIKVTGDEALCILMRRLAYPNRYTDMMDIFYRGRSSLSAIFNHMVDHVLRTKGHVLEDLNPPWLSTAHIKQFCQKLIQKGSPYKRCFGFIDGTVRPICRTKYNQREFYNGHRRCHSIKFQSLILPNGIIANLFGPIRGRRHDGHLLSRSRLVDKLEQKFAGRHSSFHIYGDSGYPLRKFLITPFKGVVNRDMEKVNKKMSALRVSVEWGFAKILQLFPFVDFKKNLKLRKQRVANYYKVATIFTNCHTCLYGGQVPQYFECDPPTIQEYLL